MLLTTAVCHFGVSRGTI